METNRASSGALPNLHKKHCCVTHADPYREKKSGLSQLWALFLENPEDQFEQIYIKAA